MTVRDVATALIVSPKTVEAHLTRVYRKLGLHTRAEFGWVMTTQPHPARPTDTGRET